MDGPFHQWLARQTPGFEENTLTLVTPAGDLEIDLRATLQAWQAFVKTELQKDLPLEKCTCLALTHSEKRVLVMRFLDPAQTTLHFPDRLLGWKKGGTQMLWIQQRLNQQGFTTYNID